MLSRFRTDYMLFNKRRMVMKAFVESQLIYFSLISMFHLRRSNSKINRLHERSLRITYCNYESSFCEFLEKDKSFSIHHKNIQSLAIEIYKFLPNASPCAMNNIFKVNQTVPYNLRKRNAVHSRNPSSLRYGTETISYIAPKIWTLVPETSKNCNSLKSFK